MKSRALVALAALLAFGSCGPEGRDPGPSVVVLGIDGMDYDVTRRMIDEGRLPNLARLEQMGGFAPLQTAVPPQSPVAWSDFITGMDSGGHGIYDFIHRDPDTMVPYLSTSLTREPEPVKFLGINIPFWTTGGGTELMRRGEAFWEVLEENGIESWVIRMPANYPPTGKATRELSGMGTPDITGTYGTFSFYTSQLFFPEAVNAQVYGKVAPYKARGQADMPNARDRIALGAGKGAVAEMATVSGGLQGSLVVGVG